MSGSPPSNVLTSADEFAETLIECGLTEDRAHVYARREGFNRANKDVAEELDKSPSLTSNLYSRAKEDVENAKKLTHYTQFPEYATELPEPIANRTIPSFNPDNILLRIHRPQLTDSQPPFSLEHSQVIETIEIDGIYLFKYNSPTETGELVYTFVTINPEYIVQFIVDWIIPCRYEPFIDQQPSGFADKWFVTDKDLPGSVSSELTKIGISEVELMNDPRFDIPLDGNILLGPKARTTEENDRYRPAYKPSPAEVASLISKGEIAITRAADLVNLQPDELRSMVD